MFLHAVHLNAAEVPGLNNNWQATFPLQILVWRRNNVKKILIKGHNRCIEGLHIQ